MATLETDVAIVGGGMGGLALAVGLRNRGIQAHVFEKSRKERKHFGTGMSIGQNGIQALEGIKPGLSDRMESVGNRVGKFTIRIRMPGEEEKLITRAPQLTESDRMFAVTWKGAHDTLVGELSTSVVHYGHQFVDYKLIECEEESQYDVVMKRVAIIHNQIPIMYVNRVHSCPAEGVETCFEVTDGDPCAVETIVVRAKLLVGADGLWSQVRKVLVGDEPRDLGLVTWLAIIAVDQIRDVHLQEDDEIKFINYPATVTGSITCYCGSGRTHWQYRVPDNCGELTKSYASDFHVHGQEARKIRVLKRIEGAEELLNLKIAIERSESQHIREDRNFDRLPVSSWSDPSGRVVLLGDAAHGMHPGPGMGARVAFEDAHQLTLLLHHAFSSQTPETAMPGAIKRYEEVRIPRCTKLQGFAAETTSWPCFVPEWVQKLSPVEKAKRNKEFFRWVNRYPADIAGDPDSTYWKPEQE